MDRLYVVVRSDISEGLQIAQACHAVAAFAVRYPEMARTWHEGESNIVILECFTLDELIAVRFDLPLTVGFCEPDIGDELTAVAVPGNEMSKRYLRKFRLALAASAAAE